MTVNTVTKRAESIVTSLGQQVDATVSGFDDSPLRFDQMVLAINEGERLLEEPYPSPTVTMRRVATLDGGFCGNNQMSYAPRYAGDPYVVDGSVISVRVDEDCDETFATIVHEVAHTWFHGSDSANWIDEGLANAIALQVVTRSQEVQTSYPPVTYCEIYLNISELEQGNPVRTSRDSYTGFSCNYTLGDGIFGALREHYGDTEFNKRISQLTRRESNRTDSPQAIADIKKVFGEDGKALDIINLWYNGYPQMRKYRHLDSVEWTFPPTIDGDYLYFAGRINEPGTVHDFILGEDPYCSHFSLYEGIGDLEWVNSISDPLPAGWTHDEDTKVAAVNHHISPETGEFRVTAKIIGNISAAEAKISLMVRSRVSTGAGGLCNISTIYSQVPVVVGRIPAELKVARYYHLNAIEWTFPPTIDGEFLHFAGKTSEPGMVHDFVLGDDQYCSQFVLYRNLINQERVATVSTPLPAGTTYSTIPTVVVVNFDIAPDVGEFSVTAKMTDLSLADIGDLSLVVSSLERVGPGGICDLGDSYSQVSVVSGAIPKELKDVKYLHLGAVEWTFPPTIDGEFLHFAGKTSEPGMVHDFVLGDDQYCSQFGLYRNFISQEWVTSIDDPLFVGWTHNEVPEIVVVNDQINSSTGEFSVTAKINDPALPRIPNLSLLVKSRERVGNDNLCAHGDSYSQVPVSDGEIPSEFKISRHYHLDGIQWTDPPTIEGNTLKFAGKALPGAVRLTWEQGYCGQFLFYERDERGYHYIDSINPFLPGNRSWAGPVAAEVAERRENADGAFEALVNLSDNVLTRYRNPVLVVTSLAAMDSATNRCGKTEVLSAVDIR